MSVHHHNTIAPKGHYLFKLGILKICEYKNMSVRICHMKCVFTFDFIASVTWKRMDLLKSFTLNYMMQRDTCIRSKDKKS